MLLTGAGLGGLTYAAHLVSLPAPPAAETALCFAGSAALLAAAFWHLRRAPHPLLNLRTLSSPTFRVTQLGGTGYMLVVGSMPFLLPLLFQTEFGWSPVKSGALTAFVFAGNVGIKPATTPLINRFGFRSVLVVSALGTAVLVAALGFTTASTPVALIALLALASGVTRSTGFTVYTTVGLADMPAELMRDANTLAATSMQLAAGLAIAASTVGLRIGGAVTGSGGRDRRAGGRPGRLHGRVLPARAHRGRLRGRGAADGPAGRRGGPPAPRRRPGDPLRLPVISVHFAVMLRCLIGNWRYPPHNQ